MNGMKKGVLVVCLLYATMACGQQHTLDSLRRALEVPQVTPQDAFKILLRMARLTEFDAYDASLQYASRALAIATAQQSETMITSALIQAGVTHSYAGTYAEALMYFERADSLWRKSGQRQKRQTSLNNLGAIYSLNGNFTRAEALYRQSLQIAREAPKKNYEAIADLYGNIGILKVYVKVYDSSLVYFMKALHLADSLRYESLQLRAMNQVGNVYRELNDFGQARAYYFRYLALARQQANKYYECLAYGDLGTMEGKLHHTTARKSYYTKALTLAGSLNNQELLAMAYNNLAQVAEDDGDLGKALSLRQQGISLSRHYGSPLDLVTRLCQLSHVLVMLNRPDSARVVLNEVQRLLARLEYDDGRLLLLENKMEVFSRLHRHDSTQFYFQAFRALADTIQRKKRIDQVSHWQVRYETARSEKEIATLTQQSTAQALKLNRQNTFLYGILFLVAVGAGVGYLFIKQARLKATQREIAVEQKLLRTQMNPHFIFNALSSIESFIYENDQREAGKYLSRFAKLMRLSLENSRREYISLAQEIRTLEHYFALQKLRLGDKIDYELTVGENVDCDNTLIPPMFAQPLIENSLEHGIVHKSGKGMIKVSFTLADEILTLVVEDNGVGRSRSRELTERKHASLASAITQERVDVMNRKKRGKVRLDLVDLVNTSGHVLGTRASFHFPLKLTYKE